MEIKKAKDGIQPKIQQCHEGAGANCKIGQMASFVTLKMKKKIMIIKTLRPRPLRTVFLTCRTCSGSCFFALHGEPYLLSGISFKMSRVTFCWERERERESSTIFSPWIEMHLPRMQIYPIGISLSYTREEKDNIYF